MQDLGGAAHLGIDLGLAPAAELQPEGDVAIDRHMRIEGIGLEDHGDAPLGGRQLIDPPPADGKLARADRLQPGDDAQQRGLAAARGADEDAELAILHLEIDVVQDLDIAEGLGDAAQRDVGHGYLTAPAVSPRTSWRENRM